jgi:hypothetical protein
MGLTYHFLKMISLLIMIIILSISSANVLKGQGKISFYGDKKSLDDQPPIGPKHGGLYGACGIIPKNLNKFAALNHKQFHSGNHCGKCLKLKHRGKSTIVQLVDMCPSCKHGSVDISHIAFGELVNGVHDASKIGILHGISWEEVDCSYLKAELHHIHLNI